MNPQTQMLNALDALVNALHPMSAAGKELTRQYSPRVIPVGWQTVNGCENVLRHIHRKLAVIVTGEIEGDGKRWIHLSVSHRDRLPSWEELKEIRDWILGPEALAIQVVPPASEHVNLHELCLHLWHCLDGDPVPDFRKAGCV